MHTRISKHRYIFGRLVESTVTELLESNIQMPRLFSALTKVEVVVNFKLYTFVMLNIPKVEFKFLFYK